MLKVLQVCVRRHVCVRRQVWTSVSCAAQRGSEGRGVTRGGVRSCTVDPNLQEQFVFVEFTDLEDDPQQEERQILHQFRSASAAGSATGSAAQLSPQKHLRSLEHQLQVLRSGDEQEVELDSLIQFQDVGFLLDDSVTATKKKKKKKKKEEAGVGKGEHRIFGSPDVDEPVSNTCCQGCGAMLHCTSSAVPGYLPSEKFKVLQQEGRLGGATCQRCHLLTHHHQALNLQLPREQYKDVVRQVRAHKALVLLVVDLLDLPDSIIPDLAELVGANKHIVVLGNKVDLLPADAPNYLQRIKRQLLWYCQDSGFHAQVTDVHLISAKTGFGVEGLISSLQRSWKYKGDVYLVGCANAGKSTLFNTLLESDYCKSRAADVIHKATISPWPGTTLNLLKFPIINPTPYRMFRRQRRLQESLQQTEEEELSQDELRRLQRLSKRGYLVGRVGRTFRTNGSPSQEIQFDPDSLAFGEDGEPTATAPSRPSSELTHNELKDTHWLYDTPGVMKELDILSLLTEHEVRLVVPTQAIVPRTFVLKPGTSLFIGALARIDYLQGQTSGWFSVVASCRVPVHVTSLEKADGIYEKHAGHALLGVPVGGSERMKEFPALVPQEVRVEGRGQLEAAADIKLSSAGWVAVTAMEGDELLLKVHGPQMAGFSVRTPPLLPRIVSLKGQRIPKSAAYKPLKAAGLLGRGLSVVSSAKTPQLKKKRRN
ncbi:nitric oxide-associated protein 1 [Acanthochromis polyacanthus]|uniref:Nitric oxide associated 1 n=1 Tax=Acanthochromis polyacanthus TaxID=80966 RepID=A0A3Q1EHG6_9TELE|nr:nitric oxide-associated protein 1 [Acanthochromis polyacanthus]